jgi:hypothetical protein
LLDLPSKRRKLLAELKMVSREHHGVEDDDDSGENYLWARTKYKRDRNVTCNGVIWSDLLRDSLSAKGKGKAVDIGGANENRDKVAAAGGIDNVVAAHPKLQPYEPERTSRTQLNHRMACI